MNHATRFKTSCHLGLIFLISLLLLGCGSGGGDRAGVNSITHTASGVVSGADEVTLILKGQTSPTKILALSNAGNYTFTNLANGSYTITPSKTGFTISPSSIVININNANISIPEFKATSNTTPTYTLSGKVTGAVLKDVLINLSGGGSATTLSDDTGSYSFTGLLKGSYTATPSLTGYIFNPANSSVTINTASATFSNFESSQTSAPTYTISGTVSGATQAGVTINLSGAGTAVTSTQTDASGNFSFSNLGNGDYTLSPNKNGYTFTPSNKVVNLSGANASGANFSASVSALPTYTLSGTVTGDVTQNVLITLSGAGSAATNTSANGTYSFTGLANGSYTATPSLAGYSFIPGSAQVTVNSANASIGNFISTKLAVPLFDISGVVSGDIRQGVTINLTGAATKSVTTDVNGNYSFTGLVNGGYTVTPLINGYTFNPGNTAVNVSGASVSGTNFTAKASALPTYTVSGTVTGDVTQNVLITLAGGKNATTTTNSSGNYSFSGLVNGNYSATPSLAGYSFSPGNSSVTINGASTTFANFVSTKVVAPTYSISGTVSGSTISGVTINLTGGATATTTTDANGAYSFNGLGNSNYTVTPSKTGYNFSPSSSAVGINGANVTTTNFTAVTYVPPTYTLSGTVTGAVTNGVLITLSGSASGTTTTNPSGNYSFSGLANGSYTATPALGGYSFSPTSTQATLNNANNTFANFVSTSKLSTITITPASANVAVLGTKQFTANGVMSDGTAYTGSFTWAYTCGLGAGMNINTTGLVKGQAAGSCSITASSGTKTSSPATVNIYQGRPLAGAIQGAPLTLTTWVSTVAGTGVAGYADGIGTAAAVSTPFGITTDGVNLYVADFGNNRIRKIIIASGEVSTLAGSGQKGAADGARNIASFNGPYGITNDGINLYVTDNNNNNIRKVVIATGDVTTLAGGGLGSANDGIGTAASFTYPYGITTDGSNLYVVDAYNHLIRKVVIATAEVTTLAGSGVRGSAEGVGKSASFDSPWDLTTDGVNLFVADTNNNKIRKIVIATGQVSSLTGLANTPVITGSADGAATTASFNVPDGITTDGSNLYVVDVNNNKIRKVEIATGTVSTVAGSGALGAADGIGSTASFYAPGSITSDGSNLYVADEFGNKIRKIQ